MSLSTAYTPLETLLLFQALRSEGVNSHSVFNRIAAQLNSIPLVRSHPTYDSGRLSPDALRELYLWLLKDEVKSDLERQREREKLLQNGDRSPTPRKRKAPSPNLPTVHEASEHAHLIPQLVTRLYARYREHAVREIREQERRHDALVREIEQIEAGEWDERLQRQNVTSATQSPGPSAAAHTLRNNASVASLSPLQKSAEGVADATSKPYTQNKIDSLINHESDAQNGVNHHQRKSSNPPLAPLSEMAPESPAFGIPLEASAPIPPQAANSSLQSGQQPPLGPPHGHPMSGAAPAPPGQQHTARPSSSPRPILPPPSGMKFPPLSPIQHVGSPNLHAPPMQQQHQYGQQPAPNRPPTGSAAHDRPAYVYPPTHSPSGYYAQPPYLDQRGAYGPMQQQHPVNPYPHQMHPAMAYPVPPVAAESPGIGHSRGNQLPIQQSPNIGLGLPPHPQQASTAPPTASRPTRPPNPRLVTDIIAALATPPRQTRKPVWKSEKHLTPAKGGTPVPRPEVEPLSPVLRRSELSARTTRSTRNRSGTGSEQPEELDAIPMPTRTRGKSKRDRSPLSAVSSTADESARMTRSQSVSTAGAPPTSDDRPGSRGNVKIEPSTPAGVAEDLEIAHEAPSGGGGGRMTRKRRGTLQSLQQQPPQKRTRQQSSSGFGDGLEDVDMTTIVATPPPRSNTVLATRNFHKLSQTIMNDINSHKHASYFANPVRDRDAPGYSAIIKQPQHLKGIRTAITVGSKAVNAAAAAMESPSAAIADHTPTKAMVGDGASTTTVELERTEDLVPPKAIVNAAQLEKEVLRMFANAVMFNPGDDGLVADTREMFEDVEAKMREWRGAEKEAGVVDAAAGEEEDGKGKRRKL